MTLGRQWSSRLPVLLTAVFGGGVFTRMAQGAGPRMSWFAAGVPALELPFGDTWGLTSRLDCVRQGHDPFVAAYFDPFGRPFNYPQVWLMLGRLGITSASTVALGALLAVTTLVTMLLLFRPRSPLTAAITAFATLSFAVLFAVERGNIDQFLFFALVTGLLLIDRLREPARTWATAGLIVGLAVLKVFPLAAAVLLLADRTRIRVFVATAGAAVLAVLLTTGGKLGLILGNTPVDTDCSFGAYAVLAALLHWPGTMVYGPSAMRTTAEIAGLGLGLLAGVAGVLFRKQSGWLFPPVDLTQARGRIALAGLAIYTSTFMMGSSYDYRLLFLMGPLAYALDDMDTLRNTRSLKIALLLLAELRRPAAFGVLPECIDCLTFVVCCAWLGASLADHLGRRVQSVGEPRGELVPQTSLAAV